MTCRSLDALEGSIFADKYRILSLLGSGGMGYVYQAEQIDLDRSVAVKILRKEYIENSWERFRAEAKAASRINHPNAVAIYDIGSTDDRIPFLVMEHLRGPTLAQLVEHQPMSFERIVTLGAQILSAMAEAHACGVIHCDLTSNNVIVERLRDGEDFAKVIDFGLSRACNNPGEGGIVGTPEYIAPEQIRGLDVGPPADLYSMGILLYEMIVGRTPFAGLNTQGIIHGHLHTPAPNPQSTIPTCPSSLGDLILRSLHKDPSYRPPTAQAMRTQLLATMNPRSISQPFQVPPLAPHVETIQSKRFAQGTRTGHVLPKQTTLPRANRLCSNLSQIPTPLIGREQEMDKLLRFCKGAEANNTATITGPRGVGKARLLTELAQRTDHQANIFVAASDPSGLHMPWYPILAILEQILGLKTSPTLSQLTHAVAQSGLPDRDVPGLAEIFAIPGPAQSLELAVRRREAHASALRTLLSAERRFPGTVFCFADIDNYDHPSQKLVQSLNVAVTNTNVRMIATCIDPSTILEGSQHIVLEPLSKNQTMEMILELTPLQKDSQERSRWYELTGGVPAAVEQLAGWLCEGNTTSAAPSQLADLISLRLNRLPVDIRRTLQAVAIHGLVAPRWLIGETLGTCDIPTQTDPRWAGLFVVDPDKITIPSRLVANLVAASTPADAKKRLHRKAFKALLQRAPLGILGHHAANSHDADSSYDHFLEAAESCVLRFDDHGAANWFGRALSAARTLQSKGRPNETRKFVHAANRLADVLRCTHQYKLAIGVLDEAEMFDPSQEQLAYMERTRGRIAIATGDIHSGVGHLRYGIGIAMRFGDRAYLCRTYIDLARAIDRLGHPQAAIDELKQAIDVITTGRGMPIHGPANLWRVGLQLSERYLRSGKLDDAEKTALAALEQAKHTNTASALGRLSALLAHIYESMEEPVRALRYRRKAIEKLRQLGDRKSTAELLIDSAGITAKLDMPAKQAENLEMAAQLASEVGWDEGIHLTKISPPTG